MASKKELSADAPAFVPDRTTPNNDETIPVNNDETIAVPQAPVEDQRAVVADKLRRLQHAQRAQLKAMLPKLPEGPAKLQLKKKIWALEKELFPQEAAAPPRRCPRRARARRRSWASTAPRRPRGARRPTSTSSSPRGTLQRRRPKVQVRRRRRPTF